MLDPGRTTYADDAVQASPSDAARFLTALDDGGKFTFQTFDDNATRGNKRLVQIRHGSLKRHWPELVQLNNRGAGIFVTVNATDLEGRKTENITKVRALFVDLDGSPLDPVATCSTPPHLIVESSPGRWHCYWLVSDVPLDRFKPMQKALAARFNGDPGVHDLPRVLRLPGFVHQKGAPFLSLLQDVDARPSYTFEQMRAAFPPAPEPPKPEPEPPGTGTDRRRGEAWARKALDASAHELANAGEGTRHETLLKKANRMGTMIARGWIDRDEVRRALYAAAESNGQIKQYGIGHFNDTFKAGIAHGILTPHPDLPDNDPPPAAATPPPIGPAPPPSGPEDFGFDHAEPPREPLPLLPWIDMSAWDHEPLPERKWAILNRVPLNQAGLFSGEGGTGKSIIELMKDVAHVAGKDWLGSMPELGPAFYIGAEDDIREIHIRLAAIAKHYGVTFAELINGGLHVMSLLGQDAVLCASRGKSGRVDTTDLYRRLYQAAGDIKPKNISIDTLSRAFAGSEIDRVEVYGYVNHMQALAMVAGGSATTLSHPSLAGLASGSGISGSTAWHGAFRFRQYLKGMKADDGEQPDNDVRQLEFKKNQYGPLTEPIVLRYQHGLFLPEAGASSLDKLAREVKAENVFLALVRRLDGQGRSVSHKPGTNYAPTTLVKEAEAKKAHLRKDELQAAMLRLFDKSKIRVNTEGGRPSRPNSKIEVCE